MSQFRGLLSSADYLGNSIAPGFQDTSFFTAFPFPPFPLNYFVGKTGYGKTEWFLDDRSHVAVDSKP